MSTALSKVLNVIEDDAITVKKRGYKRSIEFEEKMFILACSCQASHAMRNEKLRRRRWDESYLRDLAVRESRLLLSTGLTRHHLTF
jgi:PP-loop superfamily ATP-utilizing enzyme